MQTCRRALDVALDATPRDGFSFKNSQIIHRTCISGRVDFVVDGRKLLGRERISMMCGWTGSIEVLTFTRSFGPRVIW
ncbi:MAG TPA: hypothetical protein VNJ04_09535 [Gemmatimonadaceae bacterium]|nr:hypothetical protein [Gemmatimonadaceae bacterium]